MMKEKDMRSIGAFKQYLNSMIDLEAKCKVEIQKAIADDKLAYWLSWNGVYLMEVSTHADLAKKYLSRLVPDDENGDWEAFKAIMVTMLREDMPSFRVTSKSTSVAANITTDAELSFYLDVLEEIEGRW
jgi:hypothetical protein